MTGSVNDPPMTPEDIEKSIRTQLPDAVVTVQSNDNVHFDAVVVSTAFAGLRALHRHRLVYGALGVAVGGDIHALSIQAFTPEEWAARQA
jgi:acid stress-induced BolA-like protein IbaG/YrbA